MTKAFDLAREAEYIINSFTIGTEVETKVLPSMKLRSINIKQENLGWCTHRDTSVCPDGSGSEMVSPKMILSELREKQLDFIAEFLPLIEPTDTAGLHTHVGVLNIPGSSKKKIQMVRSIADFWITHERYIITQVAHRKPQRAHWTKMMFNPQFKRNVYDSIDRASDVRDIGNLLGHDSRYHSLNLYSLCEHGTVEFRVWNSDTSMDYFMNCTTFSFALVVAAYLKAQFPSSFSQEDFMSVPMFSEFHQEVKKMFTKEYVQEEWDSILTDAPQLVLA